MTLPTALHGPTTTTLAYIPSPPRGVWYLGPLPIRAYALCIIIGIIVAVWWGGRRWKARGGQDGEVLDVAIWAVPFGLVGGRLYHLATDWSTYFSANGPKTPIDAFKIWDGGLGIWGAVAFGALGAWIGARRHGIKLPPFGDAIAPPILLAQAIGRLGNYFNQELYGRDTTLPWGLKIYDRVDSAGNVDPGAITGVSNGHVVAIVHPTFLYELLWNLLIVVVLVAVDRYFRIGHGRLFALYVAAYCVGRFGVELMRADHATHIFGVRINVFTAVIVFALAALYFVLATKGREQGLEMYHSQRAEELAEEGVIGYIPDRPDDIDEADDPDDDVRRHHFGHDDHDKISDHDEISAEPDGVYDDGDYGDEVHDDEADDPTALVDLEGHHFTPADASEDAWVLEKSDDTDTTPAVTRSATVEEVSADKENPEEIAEGEAEFAEGRADDDGDVTAAGVDEDEPFLADGQEDTSGGPDPVADKDPGLDAEIIEGTDEVADGTPWTPDDAEHEPKTPNITKREG